MLNQLWNRQVRAFGATHDSRVTKMGLGAVGLCALLLTIEQLDLPDALGRTVIFGGMAIVLAVYLFYWVWPPSSDRLATLPDRELGERCFELGTRIAAMLSEHQAEDSRAMVREWGSRSSMTGEEMGRAWFRTTEDDSERRSRHVARFRQDFNGDAQAYLDELVRRGLLAADVRRRMRGTIAGAIGFQIDDMSQTLMACGRRLIG